MALAALIIASDEDGLDQGFLTLFGMPLLEFQARQAAAAGALHIIIHAERVPADLVNAMDHLKADGINAGLVRSAREAADAVHPDELVLIFAGPVQAEMAFLKAQCALGQPCILTRPLIPNLAGQELIDADNAWAGIALLPGGTLRHTATMLGDWALAPTVLRLGIQAGVKRLLLTGALTDKVQRASPGLILSDEPGASLSARLIGIAARKMATLRYRVALLALLPLALLAVSAGLVLVGWIGTALGLFVALYIPAAAIGRLAEVAMHRSRWLIFYEAARPWAGRALIIVASTGMMNDVIGWEAPVMALWCVWLLAMAPSRPAPFFADETSATTVVLLGILSPFPAAGIICALVQNLLSTLKARFSDLA